jgi:DNA mismatch repair protein MutL
MEVKFSDEQNMYRIVASVIRKNLGTNDLVPHIEFQSRSGHNDFSSLHHTGLPRLYPDPSGTRAGTDLSHSESFPFDLTKQLDQIFAKSDLPGDLPPGLQQQFQHIPREFEETDSKPIWQLHNKYILTQIRSGVMIIDQHVAHERILYEKALERMNNAVPSSQQLLFPQTVTLSSGDYSLAKDILPFLQTIGFESKLFGKNTIVVEGVPPEIKAGTESNIIQEILDEFKNNQLRVKLEAKDNLAKSFSCKAAIKAGERLTDTEMRSLIDRLFATSMPYVCPHGRPVLIKISLGELDRRFFRT